MGYKLTSQTLRLVFDDADLDTMAVDVVQDVPLSSFFDIQVLMASEEPAKVRDAMRLFGDEILHGWDIQDDDGDLPADAGGFMTLPMSLAMAIVTTWTETVGQSPKASGAALNGSSRSAVAQTATVT